jgi:hypothetical protein
MDLNRVAGQALDRLGAQRVLPLDPLPAGWRLGDWSLNLPNVLLAATLVLCIGVTAYSLLRLRRGDTSAWDMRQDDAAEAGAPAQLHLTRAELFAGTGRYVDAIHELLLQCVSDLRRHGAGRLEASLTSREILLRAKLPPASQDALASMVSVVEQTYFGRLPADLLHWQDCRAWFDLIRRALPNPGDEAGHDGAARQMKARA